jgi:tRNA threonylcarbamoyladenosine biosynthesis protein TsaB
MATFLAIDTATTLCSVALKIDNQPIIVKETGGQYTHAENLGLFIQELLADAEMTIKDIDAIVISKGPGSYTGLRIGVAMAKGMCFASNKPLIAVSTLTSLVCSALKKINEKKVLLCPMLDARRMEVYTAIYNDNLAIVETISASIIDETSFQNLLKDNVIYFFGDGSEKCKNVITHPNARFIENIQPSADGLLYFAEQKFKEKSFENLAYFEPYYLKDFVAGKPKKASL